jgi:hypothetical protein
MMLMSMGWDYVSELWPPTGLLFNPQVIYEDWEPLWNDIEGGWNLNSSIKALWQSYQQNHLVVKQEKLEKEMMNFALRNISFILRRVL